jgi:hypothetical protein
MAPLIESAMPNLSRAASGARGAFAGQLTETGKSSTVLAQPTKRDEAVQDSLDRRLLQETRSMTTMRLAISAVLVAVFPIPRVPRLAVTDGMARSRRAAT